MIYITLNRPVNRVWNVGSYQESLRSNYSHADERWKKEHRKMYDKMKGSCVFIFRSVCSLTTHFEKNQSVLNLGPSQGSFKKNNFLIWSHVDVHSERTLDIFLKVRCVGPKFNAQWYFKKKKAFILSQI